MKSDVQNILKKDEEPSIPAMLKKYNKWTNLNIENNGKKSSANIKDGLITIGKAMAIITYDYLVCSKYKLSLEKLDEFKFLKFIRNGAAHNNKFDLKHQRGSRKGEWRLKEKEVIAWSGKEITRKIQNKEIFNDFFRAWDIFLLANHFSEKLKKIDVDKIK